MGEKVHVMPNWGQEHLSRVDCWCDPYLDYEDEETGGQVWVHRRADN